MLKVAATLVVEFSETYMTDRCVVLMRQIYNV